MNCCWLMTALIAALMMVFLIPHATPSNATVILMAAATATAAPSVVAPPHPSSGSSANATLYMVRVRSCRRQDGTPSVVAVSDPEVGYMWLECASLRSRDFRPPQRALLAGDGSSLCRVEDGACKRQRTEGKADLQLGALVPISTSAPTDVDTPKLEIGTCSPYLPGYVSDPKFGRLSPTAARGDFAKLIAMPPTAEFSAELMAARAQLSIRICLESVPADAAAADEFRNLTVEAARADAEGGQRLHAFSIDPWAGRREATSPTAFIGTCVPEPPCRNSQSDSQSLPHS